jgi:hypothetical protein
MTTKGENTRKKSIRKKTTEENTHSTTKKTTEENTPLTTKKLLDVAPLQGPPPMKIRVVRFCTVPLVGPSQKSTYFDPSGH